jgi:hypothetical protein
VVCGVDQRPQLGLGDPHGDCASVVADVRDLAVALACGRLRGLWPWALRPLRRIFSGRQAVRIHHPVLVEHDLDTVVLVEQGFVVLALLALHLTELLQHVPYAKGKVSSQFFCE